MNKCIAGKKIKNKRNTFANKTNINRDNNDNQY